jgi:hypothetical protein
MARNSTTKTGLESRTHERIFSSPVALAFVRTVVARRGISEAEARQAYLDYIDRSQSKGHERPSQGRVTT